MKTILFILMLAVLALANDLQVAGGGLAITALVILIGDILARQPLPTSAEEQERRL